MNPAGQVREHLAHARAAGEPFEDAWSEAIAALSSEIDPDWIAALG